MQRGFIYIWRDRLRGMFYIGSHIGDPADAYVSSSQWFNGEYWYRPQDFKRRILARDLPLSKLRKLEHSIIKRIEPEAFGVRYYNLRSGRKKGCAAWNKGKEMSQEQRLKLSAVKKGCAAWNKGKPNPTAADNGRKSASKLRAAATGRRRLYREDGSWSWTKMEG